jgi:hypothetical protein
MNEAANAANDIQSVSKEVLIGALKKWHIFFGIPQMIRTNFLTCPARVVFLPKLAKS